MKLVDIIIAQQRALEAGKAGYARANELLEEAIRMWPRDEGKPRPVKMPDGSHRLLVDKFAGTNRIGAGLGVNRYEIETARAADITSKL